MSTHLLLKMIFLFFFYNEVMVIKIKFRDNTKINYILGGRIMKILHDKGNRVFYMRDAMGKNIAEMRYELKDEIMIINKTYVSEDIMENDIGRNLVELGISFARKEGYLIDPKCEFAMKVIRQYYPDMMANPIMF